LTKEIAMKSLYMTPCTTMTNKEFLAEMEYKIRRVRELRAERFQAECQDLYGHADAMEARSIVSTMGVREYREEEE